MEASSLDALRTLFGDRLQENVPLSSYTAARIGGPADGLVFVHSVDELVQAGQKLWEMDMPFIILGSGSNVLISDKGVRGVVIVNRARLVKFNSQLEPPTVYAESGVTPNEIAQRAERLGLAGFEWAAGIPGTLGGALYGNAGAFDGDIAGNLVSLELVHRQQGRLVWSVEKMQYGYRTSVIKRDHLPVILLSAELALRRGDSQAIRAKMEQISEQRHRAQPPGASMGSMFKNPVGGKAGSLIENAGLKGRRIGNAEISSQHANFFISNGLTRSEDMLNLMKLAQATVFDKFGVHLEPEIEILGEW